MVPHMVGTCYVTRRGASDTGVVGVEEEEDAAVGVIEAEETGKN